MPFDTMIPLWFCRVFALVNPVIKKNPLLLFTRQTYASHMKENIVKNI